MMFEDLRYLAYNIVHEEVVWTSNLFQYIQYTKVSWYKIF